MTVLTALLDGFTQMWPEMPEDEAVEIITRFVYRALNGKDYPETTSPLGPLLAGEHQTLRFAGYALASSSGRRAGPAPQVGQAVILTRIAQVAAELTPHHGAGWPPPIIPNGPAVTRPAAHGTGSRPGSDTPRSRSCHLGPYRPIVRNL